jgi:hypothetical protein
MDVEDDPHVKVNIYDACNVESVLAARTRLIGVTTFALILRVYGPTVLRDKSMSGAFVDQAPLQLVLLYTDPVMIRRFFALAFDIASEVADMETRGADPAITFTWIRVEVFRTFEFLITTEVFRLSLTVRMMTETVLIADSLTEDNDILSNSEEANIMST